MDAGIYVRISRDSEGRGLGVKRQEADCRKLCKQRGWRIVAVHVDNDVSAYRGRPRPGYERLLESLQGGQIRAVVAWHPDRLHRSPRELEDFIDLVERTRAKVATVQAGEYDLTTSAGRMTARVVGAVARGESEHKAERSRRKHLELAEAGRNSGGGTRPFGFEADRVTLRAEEAELVREAAGRILAGESLHGICRDWETRGVTTVAGGRWRTHVLRRMLLSGRIAGLRDHRGEAVTSATWPAIIDSATHEALVAVLTDPARQLNRVVRRYLLTGLAWCGREGCGARIVARPRADRRRAYVCAAGVNFDGCGKIGALAEPLEDWVTRQALRRLDSDELALALKRRQGDAADQDLADEIIAAEQHLEAIGKAVADEQIPVAEWHTARAPVAARLELLRARMAQVVRHDALEALAGQGEALGAAWPDFTLDRQRSIVAGAVERVVLLPAVAGRNFFDPDRVRIEWRS